MTWLLAAFLATAWAQGPLSRDELETETGLVERGLSADWVRDLASPDPYRRARTLLAIGQLKDRRWAAEVRRVLRSDDAPLVQCRALQALGLMRDGDSLGAIVPFLNSEYLSVRAFAAWAVGELRRPGSVRLLLPLLKEDQAPPVLGFALDAVGKLGDSVSAASVLPFLSHPDGRVREQAAKAAGAIGGEELVGDLFAQLDREDDVAVQRALAAAIGRVGGAHAASQLSYMLRNTRLPLRQQLGVEGFLAMGVAAIEPLTAVLDDPDAEPGARAAAARCLGDLKAGQANADLLRLLTDPDPGLRFAALYALGQTGDRSTLEPLRRVESGFGGETQELAAEAIARIRSRLTKS